MDVFMGTYYVPRFVLGAADLVEEKYGLPAPVSGGTLLSLKSCF